MAEELNWKFSVHDGVTRPSKEMAKSLGQAAFEFENIKHAAESLVEPIIRLGELSLDKVFEFEKAGVDALSFKEKTLSSLEALLGSGKEAQAFFSQAAWLGKATPYQTKDVIDQFQRLLSDGFSKTEVPVVFQALGDAAALKGYDVQTMNRMGNALGHMMSNGFNEGAIRMFSLDAAGTGFSKDKMFNVLQKKMGLDRAGVLAAISGGKVGAREGINAILDVLRDTAGGGQIGGGMKLHQDTFEGIKSTIESTFADAFMTREGTADEIQGWKTLKGAMMNVRDALDSTKTSGHALQEALVGAFTSITGAALHDFTGPDGLSLMQELITRLSFGIENFGHIAGFGFEAAWEGAKTFASALGLVDDSGVSLFDGPMSKEKLASIRDAMIDFGHKAGNSMALLVDILERAASAIEIISRPFTVQMESEHQSREAYLDARMAGPHFEAPWHTETAAETAARRAEFATDYDKDHPASMEKTPGSKGGSAAGSSQTMVTTINVSGADTKSDGGAALAAVVAAKHRSEMETFFRGMHDQNGGG